MNNGCWNGYQIQNAVVIIRDGRPKILCAWFLKDKAWSWNYRLSAWEERQTEAHISVCSSVPPQISRLWAPGARADDYTGECSRARRQGVGESEGSGDGSSAAGRDTAGGDGADKRTEWL